MGIRNAAVPVAQCFRNTTLLLTSVVVRFSSSCIRIREACNIDRQYTHNPRCPVSCWPRVPPLRPKQLPPSVASLFVVVACSGGRRRLGQRRRDAGRSWWGREGADEVGGRLGPFVSSCRRDLVTLIRINPDQNPPPTWFPAFTVAVALLSRPRRLSMFELSCFVIWLSREFFNANAASRQLVFGSC